MPDKVVTILDSIEHGPVKASDVKVSISETGLVTITFQLPTHKGQGDKLPKLEFDVDKNISHKPEKLGARVSWKNNEEQAVLEVKTALAARKRDSSN